MNGFACYVRPRSAPVLLPDGFSLGAFLFGPLWLLAHRAWLAAILLLCLEILLAALLPGGLRLPVLLALAWLVGLCGRDIVGWSLERRGFDFAHVVAARDEDGAYARLMQARPDLLTDLPDRPGP